MPPAYVESLPTPEQRNGSQSERLRHIGRIVTYQVPYGLKPCERRREMSLLLAE